LRSGDKVVELGALVDVALIAALAALAVFSSSMMLAI
jgi:hypothetical protein